MTSGVGVWLVGGACMHGVRGGEGRGGGGEEESVST